MTVDPYQLPLPPPLPAPTTVAIWAGQIRAILPLLGGIGLGGASVANLTDAQINGYVTAVLTLVGIASWAGTAIWSRYDERQQARVARQVAVASAVASAHATQAAGTPVAVTVAVPITPNAAAVATHIPAAEAAIVPLPTPGVAPQPAPTLPPAA
jgi:hypothetical protein